MSAYAYCDCAECRQVDYAALRRRFDALPVADQANLLWDFIDRVGAHDQTPAFFDWFAVQGEAQG